MPNLLDMTTGTLPRHVHAEPVMGTVASLDVRGADDAVARAATAQAMAWLHDVDRRFSTYRADSEISRIDRGDLREAAASEDVRWVLARCARLREESGGAFDERAGGRLDPSALVKGWAADCAADMLLCEGIADFSLTLGGDVVAHGGALPEPYWRVGIQHPLDRDALAATIDVRDTAVATSGFYERGAHIVDPRSAAPARGVLSVTVIGPELGLADAHSTAAFALGLDGPGWTLGLDGYESMTILADEQVLWTPGFPVAEDGA